jgi:putative tryptophan/tyrosine transport system substrate-binding protein
MNRRGLLSIAAVAAAWPFALRAQQKAMPVIGYFSSRSAEAETPLRTAFLDGLQHAGFVVGRNVAIEYRFAEGHPDRLPALAAELVGLPAAVLVATEPVAAMSAKKATATIPIVFLSGPDPVQVGLVASLSRPGGNATGVTLFGVEMVPKRLELLRELLPQAGLIAYLVDPRGTSAQAQIRVVEAAAQAVGQPIVILQGQSDDDIEKAFVTMAERQVRGLIAGASTYFQVVAAKLVALAARYRIPASYEWREFVVAGGLMSYSASRGEFARIAGEYVGRILKGAAPADLPVVQSSRFELVIKAIGAVLPLPPKIRT